MGDKKMGRPTDDPKSHDIRVRVSDELYQKTKDYSESNKISVSDTVRKSLKEFFEDKP